MKTFIVVLLCIGLVAVSAKSKINKRSSKRQAGAGDEPFTLTFGNTAGSGTGGCTYKGRTYQTGEAWQDGCLYNCICENGATGSYKCTDRCPTYGDLPPVCALVKKPGACCSEPQCNFQTTGGSSSGSGTGTMTGGGTVTGTGTMTGTGTVTGTGTMTGGTGGVCVDKLTNCQDYTLAVCSNHDYAKWVQDNCCAYCNGGTGGVITGGTMTGGTGGTMTGGTGGTMTGGTGGTITGGTGGMTGGTMTGTCQDAIPNCHDYTAAVCTDSSYATWVSKNCPRFCNKCSACVNTLTNCDSYDKSICSDAHYHDWVLQNCKLWCGKCSDTGNIILPGGTGTGTGGTGTGTGGTVTGTGTGIYPGGTGTGGTGTGIYPGGTGTGGTGTGIYPGGTGTGTGTMTGTMTGNCQDKIPNCADYTQAVCTNKDYATWVLNNCAHYCNKCGAGTGGTMTGTGTGGTMTGTGTGTGGTMTGTGGASASYCMDKVDCKAYESAMCTDSKYHSWASENCPVTCNMCGGTGGTGTGTITGGTGTGTGGTMTGGTMTGTCADVASNCAMLNQQAHICSDSGAKVYAQQNCARTCNLCSGSMTGGTMTGGTMTGGTMTGGTMTGGTMTGGGTCQDTIPNCSSYDPSICTSTDYKQWASQNCAHTCNLCSSMTSGGTMTGGTVTGTMTGAGTMTGTGTGTGGTMTGSGSGCVYNSHLYQQGETWKDGCKFSCQCVDGSTGKYQCSQLCVQWQLPSQCHMNPPAPGKCCQTPSCPAGFNIQYPQGYTEQ